MSERKARKLPKSPCATRRTISDEVKATSRNGSSSAGGSSRHAHLSSVERRHRNLSAIDSREVLAAMRRERRRAVRSWNEESDVLAGEELRRLQCMVNGGRRAGGGKSNMVSGLSGSEGRLQDAIRGHAHDLVRPTSTCSISSSSTTACPSSGSHISGTSWDDNSDDETLSLNGSVAAVGPPSTTEQTTPPRRNVNNDGSNSTSSTHQPINCDSQVQQPKIGLRRDSHSPRDIWGSYREVARHQYRNPPPYEEEDDPDDPGDSSPKVRLRDEETSFDGVSSSQMQRLKLIQLQQQRLIEQHARLLLTAENLQAAANNPPPSFHAQHHHHMNNSTSHHTLGPPPPPPPEYPPPHSTRGGGEELPAYNFHCATGFTYAEL